MGFVVVFREGGTDRVRWSRIFTQFPTREDAAEYIRENVNFLGGKQIIFKAGELATNGMPVGYDHTDREEDGTYDAAGWWWRNKTYSQSIAEEYYGPNGY